MSIRHLGHGVGIIRRYRNVTSIPPAIHRSGILLNNLLDIGNIAPLEFSKLLFFFNFCGRKEKDHVNNRRLDKS